MRKQRLIALAVLSCLIVAGLVVALRPPNEPSYEGKNLSAWLREVSDNQVELEGNDKPAVNAIRAMGTNALPALSRMFRAKEHDGA